MERVVVLCGGQSAEHEVSLQSARNVVRSLDRSRFELTLVGIERDGRWFELDEEKLLALDSYRAGIQETQKRQLLAVVPSTAGEFLRTCEGESLGVFDVVFPILHGTHGEDGVMQGFLELAGVAYVGAGVLGAAVGMDKEVMKRLLRDAGIANANFKVFEKGQFDAALASELLAELGAPLFVKPANLGSSVGIRKVSSPEELVAACEYAFEFDTKIVVETGIEGREIECAVLGNRSPQASLVGEVISSAEHGFYSYDAKYIDDDGAKLLIPCELDPQTLARVQELAIRSYQVLCCQGLARVDMFLQPNGDLMVNEINTIPGFTNISMYPKLWEETGVNNTTLVSRLIELAKERRAEAQALRTSLS